MQFKQGVDPKDLAAPAWWALWQADEIHKKLAERDCVCTSTGDGKHSVERSRHYTGSWGKGYGFAFDLRTWHVNATDYAIMLRQALTDEYVVIVESDHIHVHHAPKYKPV